MVRFVAILATGVLTLAACGGGEGDASGGVVAADRDAVLTAAATTLDAGTARLAMEIGVEGVGGLDAFTLRAEGVVDLASGGLAFTLDQGELIEALPGMPEDISPDDFDFEVRVVDGVAYMRAGIIVDELGVPTEWVAIDAEAALEDLGVDLTALPQLHQQLDPTSYLGWIAAASDDTIEVGTEEIRGTPTVHYRATLDFARLIEAGLEQLPDDLRARIEAEGGLRDALGPLVDAFEGVPVAADVWVDDDGRLRKLVMRMPLGELVAGLPGGAPAPELEDAVMTFAIELYDYGVAVDVEAPPADDVTDLLAVIGDDAVPAAACDVERDTLATAVEAYRARHGTTPTEADLVADGLLLREAEHHDLDAAGTPVPVGACAA